jgi:hypothetical protein
LKESCPERWQRDHVIDETISASDAKADVVNDVVTLIVSATAKDGHVERYRVSWKLVSKVGSWNLENAVTKKL